MGKRYARTAGELAAIDYVEWLAAPLKLNCSRYSVRAGRRVIRLECQLAVAEQVCKVAKSNGMRCHGLGAALKPSHVTRLAKLGMDSIDSTSWTRPVNTETARTKGWSAKNAREREEYFKKLLEKLSTIITRD